MLPVLQSSPPARELTHRSFSLSKRKIPRPLVVSELGYSPLDVTYSPERYQPLSIDHTNSPIRFKSPYLYAQLACDTAKKETQQHVPLSSHRKERQVTESTEADIRPNRTTPRPGNCPLCGFDLSDDSLADQLREDSGEIVKDIKYSLEALRLLKVLGFELNPVSRKLHCQLLEQVNYAIFPLDDSGRPSNLPYFTIYTSLDSERKQLRHQLDTSTSHLTSLETQSHRCAAESSSLKSQVQTLQATNESLKGKCTHLTSEITRLTTTLVEIQNLMENKETLNTHLMSEIKVKSRVFAHRERAHHSLQIHHEKVISDLKNQIKIIGKKDDSGLISALNEINSLKSQLKQVQSDLEKVSKLYEVMRKCYENDMKSAKDYQKSRFSELKIDESVTEMKFMQRIKRDLRPYEVLKELTQVNIADKSFDEVVEMTAGMITERNNTISELKEELERLTLQYTQFSVSKQGLIDELTDLKSRLQYTEMYEENFHLKPFKNKDKFAGLGKTLDVPKYLRCTGFVENLNLTKKQVQMMVKDIWDMKTQWQNRVKKTIPMSTFVYNYLRNRFNYFPKVVEYGYNLMDGAEKYRECPDCDLFLCTLKGDLPEEVYFDTLKMLNSLHSYFHQFSQIKGKKDVLTTGEMMLCVRHFFPRKPGPDLDACRILLDQDVQAINAKTHSVPFPLLFSKESALQTESRFLECLRKQMVMDLSRFYSMIAKEMLKRCEPKTQTVTVKQLVQVMREVEPEWEEREVYVQLTPVLGSFLQQTSTPLGLEFALRKLKGSYIRPKKLYEPKADLPLGTTSCDG